MDVTIEVSDGIQDGVLDGDWFWTKAGGITVTLCVLNIDFDSGNLLLWLLRELLVKQAYLTAHLDL